MTTDAAAITSEPVALIVPVGGAPEPVVGAVETAGADRVAFFASKETMEIVDRVRAKLRRRPAWPRIIETPDAESLEKSFVVSRGF